MNITPRPWMDDAPCRSVPPDLFYPPPGGGGHEGAKVAKSVCAACPVRLDCLNYALDTGERFGIWGGLDDGEREKLRRAA